MPGMPELSGIGVLGSYSIYKKTHTQPFVNCYNVLLRRSGKILPSSNAQRSRHTVNILLTGLWIDRATLWAAMAVYLCVTNRSSIKTVEQIELVFGVVASFHMSYTLVEGNCGISKIRVQSSGTLSQTLAGWDNLLQYTDSGQKHRCCCLPNKFRSLTPDIPCTSQWAERC